MQQAAAENFRQRDYWAVQNLIYSEPSFRLFKCARMLKDLANDKESNLLDVGCGPCALRSVLDPHIHYFGVDIAIHEPADYLREIDFANEKIAFDDRRFDFVTAMGVLEYMGNKQTSKFEEISAVLKEDGRFVMTYVNFGHYRREIWPNYNNVQSISAMTKSLRNVFNIERCFPASHHWRQKQPGKRSLRSLQMHVNFNVPILSPLLAVEYFFVCSKRR